MFRNTLKTLWRPALAIPFLSILWNVQFLLLKTFIVLEMRYKQLSHCLSTQSVPGVNKKFFFPSASGSTTSGFLLIPSSSFPSPPPHAVHICNPNAIKTSWTSGKGEKCALAKCWTLTVFRRHSRRHTGKGKREDRSLHHRTIFWGKARTYKGIAEQF